LHDFFMGDYRKVQSEKAPLHDAASDDRLVYGRELPEQYRSKFGRRRTSIEYTAENCDLQDEETPYYVALAARICGIESVQDGKGLHELNSMDLPFDWKPNERISEDQFNATNNLTLWTSMPESVTSVNLTICLVKDCTIAGMSPLTSLQRGCVAPPCRF
jgi:hypothetical protein